MYAVTAGRVRRSAPGGTADTRPFARDRPSGSVVS